MYIARLCQKAIVTIQDWSGICEHNLRLKHFQSKLSDVARSRRQQYLESVNNVFLIFKENQFWPFSYKSLAWYQIKFHAKSVTSLFYEKTHMYQQRSPSCNFHTSLIICVIIFCIFKCIFGTVSPIVCRPAWLFARLSFILKKAGLAYSNQPGQSVV